MVTIDENAVNETKPKVHRGLISLRIRNHWMEHLNVGPTSVVTSYSRDKRGCKSLMNPHPNDKYGSVLSVT